MIRLLALGLIFLLPMHTLAMAEGPVTRTTTIRVADPHIDADNGRSYTLKNTNVIEEIEIDAGHIQRNIFDFLNGVVYHERPDGSGVSYGSTGFNQLPPGRVADVQGLGCKMASESGMLVRGKDDVKYFYKHFCVDPDEQ